MFFFEKKNQKTFSTAPTARRIFYHPCAAPVAKVFASFFKKKSFPLFLPSGAKPDFSRQSSGFSFHKEQPRERGCGGCL
jgi:hypothetical protein